MLNFEEKKLLVYGVKSFNGQYYDQLKMDQIVKKHTFFKNSLELINSSDDLISRFMEVYDIYDQDKLKMFASNLGLKHIDQTLRKLFRVDSNIPKFISLKYGNILLPERIENEKIVKFNEFIMINKQNYVSDYILKEKFDEFLKMDCSFRGYFHLIIFYYIYFVLKYEKNFLICAFNKNQEFLKNYCILFMRYIINMNIKKDNYIQKKEIDEEFKDVYEIKSYLFNNAKYRMTDIIQSIPKEFEEAKKIFQNQVNLDNQKTGNFIMDQQQSRVFTIDKDMLDKLNQQENLNNNKDNFKIENDNKNIVSSTCKKQEFKNDGNSELNKKNEININDDKVIMDNIIKDIIRENDIIMNYNQIEMKNGNIPRRKEFNRKKNLSPQKSDMREVINIDGKKIIFKRKKRRKSPKDDNNKSEELANRNDIKQESKYNKSSLQNSEFKEEVKNVNQNSLNNNKNSLNSENNINKKNLNENDDNQNCNKFYNRKNYNDLQYRFNKEKFLKQKSKFNQNQYKNNYKNYNYSYHNKKNNGFKKNNNAVEVEVDCPPNQQA